MDENINYLPLVQGGRWAIGREIGGRRLYLIQDTPVGFLGDAAFVLAILRINPIEKNLDRYFPHQGARGRCPTLELMERFARLDARVKVKDEVGV